MSETFRQILEQIGSIARHHPDYRFAFIDKFTCKLAPELDHMPWVEDLFAQWQAMPAPRQEICQEMFANALLQARQATYQPVNELDLFLEHQLYGIQDEQVVQKGTVSQALKQIEDRKRPPAPPRVPVSGHTNPLNPRQLPKE